MSIGRCWGDAESRTGLVQCQPGKISQFHQIAGKLIEFCETFECIVERDELGGSDGRDDVEFFEIDAMPIAAVTAAYMSASVPATTRAVNVDAFNS